jgi:hypothetical protein
MEEWLKTFASAAVGLGLMACLVFMFRMFVRRPKHLSDKDAPGIRSVAVFQGDASELFRDDREDLPWVGVHLFSELCSGLAAKGIRIEERSPVDFAQGARCVVDEEPFSLVLERLDDCWVISVEWAPRTMPERRHAQLSRRVYAPGDSPALRRLLAALDAWLKSHPQLSGVGWHRKERWLGSSFSDASPVPVEPLGCG